MKVYYSIVSNWVESSESRKPILNKYILLARIVTSPLNYLIFLCFFFFACESLFCFDFDFLFSHLCENVFNTALIVLALFAICGWMLKGWLQGGKDILGRRGGQGKKNTPQEQK